MYKNSTYSSKLKKGSIFIEPFCFACFSRSFSVSGYQDSNLGPPAPKAGALTGLRYIPKYFCGEGGIRTRGTELSVRQFSKLVVSATHPPHLLFLK